MRKIQNAPPGEKALDAEVSHSAAAARIAPAASRS
jgi:hypothetical protein